MQKFGNTEVSADNSRYDYDGSGNLIYYGISAPRVLDADAKWQIRKFEYDGSGNLTAIKYANGFKRFDQTWDSRAGLSYS